MMGRIWGLLLVLSITSFTHACSCMGPSPTCSAFSQSPIIFKGKVIELTLLRPPVTPIKNLDRTTSTIINSGQYKVRFSVSETFRGQVQQEITVYTQEQRSACGFPFKNGTEYIVFTDENKATGQLETSKCSHTHEFEAAKDDIDVSFMRGFAKAPAGATIFGNLKMPSGVVSSAAQVILRGAENHDLAPNEKGAYSIAGLPPGRYTVTAKVPAGFSTRGMRTVSVPDKGCAEVDWPIYYDGHIKGRVTDTTGMPLGNMSMELSRRDRSSRNGFSGVNMLNTDADGRYDFAQVPPGDYFVVANQLGPSPERPYPRVYFPDAETQETATEVHLESSAVQEHIDITLPKAWRSVIVRTKIVLQDGNPAAGAEISAYERQLMGWRTSMVGPH